MRYVLDTNVASALMNSDARVMARLHEVDRREVGLPQPVLAEIAYGIARLPASKKRKWLQERFDLLRTEIGRCPWTDDVSDRLGEVKSTLERSGKRIEDFDAAIAAHALVEGAVLVTAKLDDMKRVPGLVVEDWSA